ncbi:MAG: hypothetical protein WC389_21385 [Lutibacter sp.]
MAKESKDMMFLSFYLSQYSTKRNLDKVFKQWFSKKDAQNPRKSKEEWDALMKEFFAETEGKK